MLHRDLRILHRLGLILASAACLLQATSTSRQSLEQITRESSDIARVRVIRSWCGWDPSHTFIWTHYELDVLDSWKGARAGHLVISEPGGELDGIRMSIAGMPRYQTGEEVIVFAKPVPNGYLRTTGLGQGRLVITVDPSTGEKRVYPDLSDVKLFDPQGAPGRAAEASVRPGMSLTSLRSQVLALLDDASKGGAK